MPLSDLFAGYQSGYDQAQVGKARRARNKALDEMDPGQKETLGWEGSQKTPGNWFSDFITADLKTEQRAKTPAQKLALDEFEQQKKQWDQLLPIRQQQAKTAELAKQIQMTGVMEKLKLSEQALLDTQDDQALDAEWKSKRSAMTEEEKLADTNIPAFKTPKFLTSGYQQILREQNSVAAKAAAQKAIQERQAKILEQTGQQRAAAAATGHEYKMAEIDERIEKSKKIAETVLDKAKLINYRNELHSISTSGSSAVTKAKLIDAVNKKYGLSGKLNFDESQAPMTIDSPPAGAPSPEAPAVQFKFTPGKGIE